MPLSEGLPEMQPQPINLDEIYLAALALPGERERAAFLDQACAGDPRQRERVERLLRAQPHVERFLESVAAPIAPTISDPQIAEKPGTQIGPYKLLEQIGEGGFGIVFMAEQQHPVRRKVALKVLKPGMDSQQVIARFEAERQALALMDHPNIARVLDAGATESGRPYFVMELVKGVPMTAYCDEHQLSPRERLELFVSVCHAVQHAHQKGIIHRDIKPSNVLVAQHDGKPVVKVIDFGVAKALGQQLTDKTVFTGLTQMIGTPLYMSPEQAELSGLDIDTRTDIYSLGVLLYELLTGTTPFDKERLKSAAFDEIRRIIREDEPPKPSTRLSDLSRSGLPSRTSGMHGSERITGPVRQTGPTSLASIAALRKMEPRKLSQLVRGELDWIVMKSLEKDRSRRYETASSLAADLQHYLNDEPVAACPPSATYRFQKFARRNKVAIVTTEIVAASLILGLLATTWQAFRATTAERQARENEQRAVENEQKAIKERDQKDIARREAMASAKRARAAAEAEVEQRKLAETAAAAETAQRLRAEDNAKLAMAVLDEIIMQESRKRLTPYMQDDVKGLGSNPAREKQEREFLVKGLTFYEQLANTNATDWAARRARASAYTNVGLLQRDLKNHVESEKAFHQAVRLLEELADERPDDFDNRLGLATTCMWSSRPYRDSGRIEPAEEITRHALALFEKLVADFPDQRPRIQEGIGDCQRTLADLLKRTGRAQEAEEAFRQSLAICTELAAANPKHAAYRYILAHNLGELGDLYDQTGRSSKASAAWEEARSLFEKLASEIPGEFGYQDCAAHLDWKLAGLLKRASKPKEAEETYRRALRVFEKLAADYPAVFFYRQEEAYNYWLLGGLLKETGQVQEAETAYRQALRIHERLVADFPKSGEYRSRLGFNYEILGGFLRGRGRAEEAVASYRAARDIWEKLVADFPGNATYYNIFAWRLATSLDSDLRDGPRAVELSRRAIELAPEQATFWNTLGTASYRAGDWKAAIEALMKSQELGNSSPAHDWFFLAMAEWQLGNKDAARGWYDKASQWTKENQKALQGNPAHAEELQRFEAEARDVLGIKDK